MDIRNKEKCFLLLLLLGEMLGVEILLLSGQGFGIVVQVVIGFKIFSLYIGHKGR
jgi:hypothetical protein